MADHSDEEIPFAQAFEGVDDVIEGVRIKRAEALVYEDGLQLRPHTLGSEIAYVLRKGQREGEARKKRLPSGECVNAAGLVCVHMVDDVELAVLRDEAVAVVRDTQQFLRCACC